MVLQIGVILGDDIQEDQRSFLFVAQAVGLSRTGNGHISCLYRGFFPCAVGKDPFPGNDDIGVFIETMFVAADGRTFSKVR